MCHEDPEALIVGLDLPDFHGYQEIFLGGNFSVSLMNYEIGNWLIKIYTVAIATTEEQIAYAYA